MVGFIRILRASMPSFGAEIHRSGAVGFPAGAEKPLFPGAGKASERVENADLYQTAKELTLGFFGGL
jgi:hypothetical protein